MAPFSSSGRYTELSQHIICCLGCVVATHPSGLPLRPCLPVLVPCCGTDPCRSSCPFPFSFHRHPCVPSLFPHCTWRLPCRGSWFGATSGSIPGPPVAVCPFPITPGASPCVVRGSVPLLVIFGLLQPCVLSLSPLALSLRGSWFGPPLGSRQATAFPLRLVGLTLSSHPRAFSEPVSSPLLVRFPTHSFSLRFCCSLSHFVRAGDIIALRVVFGFFCSGKTSLVYILLFV